MSKNIRFRGTKESLIGWRTLLIATLGREPSAVEETTDRWGYKRFSMDLSMTETDRKKMMRHWYRNAGRGLNGAGQPLKWNDCIAFEIV